LSLTWNKHTLDLVSSKAYKTVCTLLIHTALWSCCFLRLQFDPYMTVLSSMFSCKSVVHAEPITQLFPTDVVPIKRAGTKRSQFRPAFIWQIANGCYVPRASMVFLWPIPSPSTSRGICNVALVSYLLKDFFSNSLHILTATNFENIVVSNNQWSSIPGSLVNIY
jgi:hypothetical protein